MRSENKLITVTVKNGWITLECSVDWLYQKTLVESAIKKLRRVLGITDKMEVEPTVSPRLRNFFRTKQQKERTLRQKLVSKSTRRSLHSSALKSPEKVRAQLAPNAPMADQGSAKTCWT
jgi:hypothetical protein